MFLPPVAGSSMSGAGFSSTLVLIDYGSETVDR
jgi:hypothetical protein